MLIVAECISSYEEVEKLVRHISSRLSLFKEFVNQSLIFSIEFCLRELLNNAVEHGNQFDGAKKIQCLFHYIDGEIYISVKDEGMGFCVESALEEIDCEDMMRSRTRGLKTLTLLGFELDCKNGWVIAKKSIGSGKEGQF